MVEINECFKFSLMIQFVSLICMILGLMFDLCFNEIGTILNFISIIGYIYSISKW